MSSSNPIIPPGSPLNRTQPAVNSKLVLTICGLVGIHVFILAGLLIQGCQRQDTSRGAMPELGSNLPPLPSEPESQTPAPLPPEPRLEPLRPLTPGPSTTVQPSTNPNTVTDFHNTPPETLPANRPPTVQAVPRTPSAPAMDIPPAGAAPEGPMVTYQVKAGDNLTKIARAHNTTVNAIRAANGLKTDRILVGQKLKVPQGSPATQPASSGAAPAPLPR